MAYFVYKIFAEFSNPFPFIFILLILSQENKETTETQYQDEF